MTFIRALSVDDPAIGGKARSLARLKSLGLAVPAGFAIDAAFSRALRAGGPALPAQLRHATDVTTLDEARAALLTAPLPEDFRRELAAALTTLDSTADPDVTFAVRSSAANEDSAEAAAPGIFESCVRVRRADVADAVRAVLSSALSPAAWTYALRRAAPSADLAVLVHRFVEATAHGAAAANGDAASVTVATEQGQPTAAARASIQAAVTVATMRFGASELEWAAQGDVVTFLQLRPFHPTPLAARQRDIASGPMTDDGWTWDAAHNPAPLSPAQAGLVALVDERCRTGLRQQVRGGYLFFTLANHGGTAVSDGDSAPEAARAMFDRLSADVDARSAALPEPPSVEAAVDLYVAAYAPLFGAIHPACVQARATLKAFLATWFPDESVSPADLTTGIVSAATHRRSLARAIGGARGAQGRQAAIDAYLRAFGDEGPRWDVAEPTFREAPERLLFLTSAVLSPGAHAMPPHDTTVAAVTARLPESLRDPFNDVVTAARQAVAVGEDDDHLFARLQAVVRRALLALGQRLVATGRLPSVDDVFFLPLPVARALDAPRLAASLWPGGAAALDALDLSSLASEGRRAFAIASAAPPPLPETRGPGDSLVAGVPGSPGRALGRAVHHPSSTPLHADAILIAVTLLPTELPLLTPAALVVETGTVLGHVAAQARERGIPAVVSARGARAAIREGQLIIVDGTRGQITLLDEPG